MKLRGIDVNDEADRRKIADCGNQIRNYFNTRNEIMKNRASNYTAVKDKTLTGIGNLFIEKKNETTKDNLSPKKIEKQFTSDSINKMDELLTFKSMNHAVESELKKNPIKVQGMGLKDEFNNFFPVDYKKPDWRVKEYKSLNNSQIKIDNIFL